MFPFVYLVLPVILLALCARFRPGLTWALIPLCPVLDILFFRTEFSYYEARVFFVFFSGIQAVALAIAAVLTALLRERPRFRCRLFGALAALTATLMVLIVGMQYQHHAYFAYLNSAPASVTLIYAIPFLPFLLVFLGLALYYARKK